MVAFVLRKVDEKLLGALSLQNSKDFTVYLPEYDPIEADYEAQLPFRHGDWQQTDEELTCILESGALPGPDFVEQVLRTARKNPEYEVYHVNLEGQEEFPKKADAKKIFKLTLVDRLEAPLSSFVFRSATLRNRVVLKADGSPDPLPTVMCCAPVRNVGGLELPWTAPETGNDPAAVEKGVLDTLEVLRWTEGFFGDDDYPLSVGDQIRLFCKELAKLYPSYTAEELKERLYTYDITQKPIRKMRANCAFKKAIKEREKAL